MANSIKVERLVSEVVSGEIVLPDFQRSFVWEPDDIRELLVSVLSDIHIGTMLILEGISEKESPFALRLFEGVDKIKPNTKINSIVKIILDGQQRTTALIYALHEPNLPLKNRKKPFKYFLDFNKALGGDWEKSVICFSVDERKKKSEIKDNKMIVPFSELLDTKKITSKFKSEDKFDEIYDIVKKFLDYQIHLIALPKDTSLNRIVETFEKINRTGQPLSIFELLTAKLYIDKIKLRDLWENVKTKYESFANDAKPEFILKTIALNRGLEPIRSNLLNLESSNFLQDWECATQSLNEAYIRVTDIKNGYGVFDFKKWMPYSTMLVPLASMINVIKREKLESPNNYKKVDEWYWTSVFANRYDQAVDTTSYSDLKAVKKWFSEDKSKPDFIDNFNPEDIDFNTDRSVSAVYRGVFNLIVLSGCLDYRTGKPPQFDRNRLQDDHIFPKKFKNNSVLNRSLISTNITKGDKNPSSYFAERIEEYGENMLKNILKSHLIPADAIQDLLEDNLSGFIEKRKREIINEINRRINRTEYNNHTFR